MKQAYIDEYALAHFCLEQIDLMRRDLWSNYHLEAVAWFEGRGANFGSYRFALAYSGVDPVMIRSEIERAKEWFKKNHSPQPPQKLAPRFSTGELPTQYQILKALIRPAKTREIANQLGLTTSLINHHLRRLYQKGIVKYFLKPSPHPYRVWEIKKANWEQYL